MTDSARPAGRRLPPGGHHFGGDFEALSARIAEFIRRTAEVR
jgi:type IV secretory pathway VirJ component